MARADGDGRELEMDEEDQDEAALGFEHTLMYGRYSKDLGEFAKTESKRLKEIDKKRKLDEKLRRQELHRYRGKWTRRVGKVFGFVWKKTFARIGEDWVFLTVLGVLMALISFVMDYGIAMCNKGKSFVGHALISADFAL
ncbi:chloride channel protein 2-like [Pollicipes pollicipes]|uniref:chloride channel protein 2-like n=1 Tax=Pollicipes pollicipes TaxID=41117 RepID=UPI0018855D50|nr:chloride channel protein 2-like [Pollicipes pollicipes]